MTQTTNRLNVRIHKSDVTEFVWLESLGDDGFIAYVKRVGGWADKEYRHTLYKDTDKIYDVVTSKTMGSKWLARTYQEVK